MPISGFSSVILFGFNLFFLFLNLDHIAEALGEIAHVIVDLSRE